MRKAVPVLLALLLAGAAAAQEDAAPPAHGPAAERARPAPRFVLPALTTFRLFPQLEPDPRLGLGAISEEGRPFHQAGDPDSLFTLGAPTPEGEVHLKAAVEVNEIFLKAIPPDPLVSPDDTRPRAAGSYLPVDNQGRPYQLRLGARLVW